MLEWWAEFSKRRPVAHVLRAVERFNVRGGAQLAAAIAFFSVLALVPIIMLAFSALGLILTVFRPDALADLEKLIEQQLTTNSNLGESLYRVIVSALNSWASLSIIALGIIIWVGSSWVGNLKRAVRLLMREEVDKPGKQLPLPLDILANFAGLLGLLVGIAATFVASGGSTWLAGTIGGWLGFEELPGWSWALRVLGLVVSFAMGAVLFRLLFGWFSPRPVPSHLAWVGSGIGSFGLIVLQALTGYLIGAFSRNLGFAVFGSTLVLMLFLNLFATLLLYIAAWLATNEEPAPALEVAVAEPEPVPEPDRPGEVYVSSEVAQKSLGIGLGTGYVVGAATGLGVGAVLTSILARLFGRRG
ncbi:MAG: YhjD/YihY/BrkB family envelope integrity protein [Propionicimonas sp.]|uniref:YihY/virulence factor BrkB family protein n=1 Tax=Propionicimonas sp. TaxID=1955623 RepID=UPI003D0F1664